MSTADAPVGKEFQYWHELAHQRGLPLQLKALGEQPFQAEAVCRDVGAIHVSSHRCSPCRADWTDAGIALAGQDPLLFQFVLAGTLLGEQDTRVVQLAYGAGAFYDVARPFSMVNAGRIELLAVAVPRALLAGSVSGIDRLAGVDLGQAGTLMPLVRDYAARLVLATPSLDADTADRVGRNLADLIGAMLAEAAGRMPQGLSEYKMAALMRVRRYVEQHLSDPELKPAQVAQALRLSPRYINQLLQAEGTSLGRLIWRRRLERIAADLHDPALGGRSISTIALARGFRNLAHFSAAFRQHYGMPPRDYRQA